MKSLEDDAGCYDHRCQGNHLFCLKSEFGSYFFKLEIKRNCVITPIARVARSTCIKMVDSHFSVAYIGKLATKKSPRRNNCGLVGKVLSKKRSSLWPSHNRRLIDFRSRVEDLVRVTIVTCGDHWK